MKSRRSFWFALLLASTGLAQPAQLPPAGGEAERVFFSYRNPSQTPSEYSFELFKDCRAVYLAFAALAGDEAGAEAAAGPMPAFDGSPTEASPRQEVRLSDPACAWIFATAADLDHFRHDFEFKKRKVAYTGDRVLGYSAPGISNRTSFTWSANPQVQQLSAFFEGVAGTLAVAPRLRYQRRYDRLGLNETLKNVESQARSGWLRELGLIAPELRAIADDVLIMNIARERARRLLHMAETPADPARAKK